MTGRAKNLNNLLGQRIRQLRAERYETQKDIARVVNRGESTVRMWELGKSQPDVETIKLLADHFGVSVSDIVGESDDREQSGVISGDEFSEHERRVIFAYRENPQLQAAIDQILGVEREEYTRLYAAAFSDDNRPDGIIYMKKDEWERIKNAPETKDTLL